MTQPHSQDNDKTNTAEDADAENTVGPQDAQEQYEQAQDLSQDEEPAVVGGEEESLAEEIPLTAVADGDADAESRIAALEVELAEAKDKMIRAVAEADNVRKRSERERADTAKFAVTGFAKNLISVLDNLTRALGTVTPEARAENEVMENLMVGLEATERELERAFESAGIQKINPLDEKFDPNFHEVMMEVDAPDKAPGVVMQVLETGYVIHDRLLRPARVLVTKGGKPAETVDEEV